ncbi:MAG: UV DNA damage repair endonuclease UvsE [Verrucomicrobia bacterium]|nr:UV DNA damage repair endonuclease UvsE [Verrucomicrobiota bacterium]
MDAQLLKIRWGLCCTFREAPIKFRTATAAYVLKLKLQDRIKYLSQIALDNLNALEASLCYCSTHQIGSFRINSQFLPLYTHPKVGYQIEDLLDAGLILEKFAHCKNLAQKKGLRLTFHPDQFVVLNSPHASVLKNSIQELEYHGLLAELAGADVINIHAGGAYGDKPTALQRLIENFAQLSSRVQTRLTLENDDTTFTPQDLLPVCKQLNVPLVYDVHHHRCLPDGLSIEEASQLAYSTWEREPLFHLSSPISGWKGAYPERHHEYIDIQDFPRSWLKLKSFTLEVEAKAKELAVKRLQEDISKMI